jgi:hypothetical protein
MRAGLAGSGVRADQHAHRAGQDIEHVVLRTRMRAGPLGVDGSGTTPDRCRPGSGTTCSSFLSCSSCSSWPRVSPRSGLECQRFVDLLRQHIIDRRCCRYAVTVASKSLLRQITAALGALDAADGPMSRLDAARRLREAAEEMEAAQVEAARKAGATWNEIGACYGLTKQGAQQRFRAPRNRAEAGTVPPEAKRPGPLASPDLVIEHPVRSVERDFIVLGMHGGLVNM